MSETFDCRSRPCPDRGDICGACQGHRVTKRIRDVADIICWCSQGQHLEELDDQRDRDHHYRLALRYLDEVPK